MKGNKIGLAAMICSFLIGVGAVSVLLMQSPQKEKDSIVADDSKFNPAPTEESLLRKDAIAVMALCNRVSEIKILDVKGRRGFDEVYDELVAADQWVIPCLINKVTDTTIMPDPRPFRISNETKVGDVAYFVLIRITKLDFTEFLPAKVKERYKTQGVYAYHKYIERKGSREQLKNRLKLWDAIRTVQE